MRISKQQVAILKFLNLGRNFPTWFTPSAIGEALYPDKPRTTQASWAVKKLAVLQRLGFVTRRPGSERGSVKRADYSITMAGRDFLREGGN